MTLFKKKTGEKKYKPEIQRSSFTDILHASVFAGIVTAAFILLGGIYALAPGSIIFYIMLIIIAGILVFLFAPINLIPEKITRKYGNKPKTIKITGNKDQLNQIAPNSIEITPDTVKINKYYTRTFNIEQYPPQIMDGWLAPVIASNENITISTHIYPDNADVVKANLDMEIGKIDAQIMGMSSTDPKAVPLQHISGQLKNYRDLLIAGQTQPFKTEIYLTLKAKTKKELEENKKETTRWFKGRNITLKPAYMKMDKATRSVLPTGINYLGQYHSFDTHSLKTFFPFTRNVFGTENGVIYGYTVDDNPVIFDRHKMRAPHIAVLGSTGSGKTYFTSVICGREYIYNPEMRLFIVDPTPLPDPTGKLPPMSEYTPLTKKYGGQVIKFGTRGQDIIINPFDIRTVSTKADLPVTEKIQRLSAFFSLIFELTKQESAVIESILPNVYKKKGITDNINLPTFSGDSPIFLDMQQEMKEFAKSPEAYPQDRAICEKLIRLLEPWVTGPYSGLNHQTNISLKARWITFDISLLRGTPMFVPLAYLIMDFINAQVKQDSSTKLCLFDEVHLILSQKIIRVELEKMLREFRKYNAGVWLASQSAEDFLQYPEGRVMLDNCPINVLMKHDIIGEQMQERWKFTISEQTLIKRAATGREGYSEALFIAENSRSKLIIVSFPFEHELIKRAWEEPMSKTPPEDGSTQTQEIL